ncbi:MAG: HD domain-containing protein [Lachnospiraceae bacterium]|nr:HD domain-containing protein [Lachnospiraceae bacterium]
MNAKTKEYLKKVIVYVLAILINIGGNRLAGLLHLPLYVDNIGTLLSAILGGYLPGMVVGYLTNVFNMSGNPENVYYASLSVLIAVAAAFFAKRGFFKKFHKALLTVPVFALIGGGIGSVLTYFLYGFGLGEGISAPFAKTLLEKGTLNVFCAQMVSDVTIDLIDKLITVVIVFLLLKLIPEKVRENLRLTGWVQKPLSDEEKRAAQSSPTKGFSLRTKIILIITLIMVFVASVTTTISYILYHQFSIQQYTYIGKQVAQLAAASVDGNRVNAYLADGEDVPGYQFTADRLESLMHSAPDVAYVYVYQIREDGCHVVFDVDTEEVEGAEVGTVVPFDESFIDQVPTLLAGGSIEPIITDDTYGWLLTDYEPVFDSMGNCVCYAAADISMTDIRSNGVSFLAKVASLFIGFFILILAFCIWLANYHLIYPVNAMTLAASDFAFNTEKDRGQSVERLESLMIDTGDELENLYDALSTTIAETVQHLEDVRQKGEEIAKIQNGLIYVLADIVESRDQNTGDHVRKTAAYVELIMKQMKKEGICADMLTDAYVDDIVNSAPLHDIGKIKVPDAILNKPGRLTDDEFTVMKTHTSAGSEIISGAMALVSDSRYLKEAKNLAAYHHEKWDGTGYPTGLKGEEIPLSARVMAVADVFDALLSKRSYKDPFTFEQAMDIIKEGSGKHFDPQIVQAFVDVSEEVRQVAERLAHMHETDDANTPEEKN